MAWNIQGQPFQYHQPVAPEVPVADNTGAKIISAGASAGIEAFTRMALANKQAQLEREKMIQDADLAAKGLELRKQELALDYDLKKKLYGSYETNAEANKAKAIGGVARFVEERDRRNMMEQEALAFNDSIRAEPEYQSVTNPTYMAEHPVEWAADFRRFQDNHASDQVSIAADVIKRYKPLADKQTVPFREGAVWQPGHDGLPDKDGAIPHVPGRFETKDSVLRHIPVYQLAERYKQAKPDSPEQKQILWGLMAAGQQQIATKLEETGQYIDEEKTDEKTKKKYTLRTQVVQRQNVFSVTPEIKKKLDAGEKADFSRGSDRTPEMFRAKYKKGGAMGVDYSGNLEQQIQENDQNMPLPQADPGATSTRAGQLRDQRAIDEANEAPQDYSTSIPVEPGALPDVSSATPTFEPTQTDTYLQHARNALAAGAPRELVAQRLASLHIDPNLLMA